MPLPWSVLCCTFLVTATAAASTDRAASQLVSGLAEVCLSSARDSLCPSLDRLEATLESLRPPTPSCPAGWSQYSSICYLIPPQTATWLQAHHYCAQLDRRARLGSVHPASARHVRGLAAASDADRVWIGLVQLSGRRWGWTDGTPLDHTEWRRGEPTFAGEHCGHIYGPQNSLEGWNDTECDRECHFLCEIRLDQQ